MQRPRLVATDLDGDGWIEPARCAEDPRSAPGRAERCDGLDEDCDGVVDEVLATPEPGLPSGPRGCTADPRELDLRRDLFHCGGCGVACREGTVCCDGVCTTGPCG